MKRNALQILMFVAAGLAASCSPLAKIIKSGDAEVMYQTALDLYDQEKYTKTLQVLAQVEPIYAGTSREDTIAYYTAATYYKMGDFFNSETALDDFRRRFGRSAFIEDVEYMYTMGFYFSSPEANRDQTTTSMALANIQEYMQRYPESSKMEVCKERIVELQNKLYDKALINAKTYYKIGRYQSAIVALGNAIGDYPDTPHREELLYLLLKSHFEYANGSVRSTQKDRFINMMDAYYNLITEFPDSDHRKEAERMRKIAERHIGGKDVEKTAEKETESQDGI